MNTQTFNPILHRRGLLDVTDLTPDEKKQLYAFLTAQGMTQSTAYARFFERGFDEWELRGIDAIKRDFCDRHALNHLRQTGEGFYSALTGPGQKTALLNLMSELGMEHRNTVSTRFDADNWKPWERRGLRDLLTDLCVSSAI